GSSGRFRARAPPVPPRRRSPAHRTRSCASRALSDEPTPQVPLPTTAWGGEELLGASLSHLSLVCRKCGQNLPLLLLGHLEEVKRSPKFSRDFIELGRRDLQFAMGLFEAKGSTAHLRGCILLGATGNVADPEGAHELEAWKSAQIVGVPFPEGRV